MDHFNTAMMVKWIQLVVLLLQAYEGTTIILSASSSGVVSVCPGKQLSLVCTMNHNSVLKWNISLPEGNNISLRSIPYSGFTPPLNLTLNDAADTVAFHFNRTSKEHMLPLIAELLIDRVSTNLNGSNVLCSPSNDSDPQITFAIHVLGENSFHPAKVEMDELTFQSTNFTVTLTWAQEAQVSYNISIDPLTELVPVTNTTWKVTGNYNTLYNVSIEATLCDQYSKRTKIFLEYATCELLTRESLGTSVTINSTEYRNPPVTGDNVTFVCLSGELMGPKRTTCQKNGEWEPDPSGTMCKQAPPSSRCDPPPQPINGYILTNTSNNTVTFVCQNQTQSYYRETIFLATCNEHGAWEPDPRDHCIIFDSESNENILNGVLLGSVLGSSFVAIIVVIASVLIIVILLKKGYKKLRRWLPDREQNTHNLSPDENQNSTDQAETVLYADIGQSSFANRPKISIGLDYDDHVEYAQLNHNSLTVKSDEIQPASSVDDTLNLDTLLIQVKAAATPMWYQLGEALGIQKELLDRYSSRPPEESIIEMLDQWLRGGPQRRTWRDVTDALRKINLQLLANDIEKVYETGLLPIEINTNDIPKDPILPKTTEFPPPMLSKNTSDSHLISQHRPTLPARTKQNSDSRLISYQHVQHTHTGCTMNVVPLRPVQETTFSAVMLDSDHEPAPPPLPPKPSATSE